MIVDNTSATAQNIIANLTAVLTMSKMSTNEKRALTILKEWTGENDLNDVAPTVFNKWLYWYLKDTFEDEFGKDNFTILLNTHIIKQTIEAQSQNANSPWWDNITTKDRKETQKKS